MTLIAHQWCVLVKGTYTINEYQIVLVIANWHMPLVYNSHSLVRHMMRNEETHTRVSNTCFEKKNYFIHYQVARVVVVPDSASDCIRMR